MSETKTVDQIADEIIENSDGSFYLAKEENYEKLSQSEQSEVDDLVSVQIDACGSCGWNYRVDSMEDSTVFEEQICWQCADNERADAEEDESEAECGRCGESNDFDAMNVIEGEYVCVNCETNEDD